MSRSGAAGGGGGGVTDPTLDPRLDVLEAKLPKVGGLIDLGLAPRAKYLGLAADADPLVSLSAANAATSVANVAFTNFNSGSPDAFRWRGGRKGSRSTGGFAMAYVDLPTDPPAITVPYSVEFAFAGSVLEVAIGTLTASLVCRVSVDGRIIATGANKLFGVRQIAVSGNARYQLKLDWQGVRAPQGERVVRIELHSAAVQGVNAPKTDPVHPSAEFPIRTTGVFFGDSFFEGTNADSILASMSQIAAYYAGIDNPVMASQGGTGYIANGQTTDPGRGTIGSRVAGVVALNAITPIDHVIVGAGYNDVGVSSAAAIGAAATQAFADLRAGLPNAHLWALGPWSLGSPVAQATLDAGNAIKAAVEAVGGTYIDQYTVPWITGAGTVAVPGTSTGNAALYVTSVADPHPPPEGHHFYGYRIGAAINAVQAAA